MSEDEETNTKDTAGATDSPSTSNPAGWQNLPDSVYSRVGRYLTLGRGNADLLNLCVVCSKEVADIIRLDHLHKNTEYLAVYRFHFL
mmetsp:Transcript_14048/g.28331  ORF Transcript_14048/g.28331 Transcript_14048/m.28331 type:complete len:87 (+) Transcript_14048:212-472(+)